MSVTILHHDRENALVRSLVDYLRRAGMAASFSAPPGSVGEGGRVANTRGLVIVPDTEGNAKLAAASVALAETNPDLFVLCITDLMPAETYKRLLRSSRGEWIQWQNVEKELPGALSQAVKAQTPRGAKIVSLFPSKGGVGNTTVALEVGVALSRSRRDTAANVAVIDLNFQGSPLADLVDLQARLEISEVISRPDRLDRQLIDIFASKYSDNLDLFASPIRPKSIDEVEPKVIFSLLDEISKHYSLIMVDLPSRWSGWNDNILQGSDALVVTGGNTVPAVRQLASRIQHVEDLGVPPERVAVFVNQCETGLFGAMPRRADIDRAFPGRQVLYAPSDSVTAIQAANSGRPMLELAPRRPIGKAIRKLADSVRTAAQLAPTASR